MKKPRQTEPEPGSAEYYRQKRKAKYKKQGEDKNPEDDQVWDEILQRYVRTPLASKLKFARRPPEILTQEPPERKHVVAPWIGKGQLAFLAMAGGAGKGFLSLSLAVHVAAGRRWFGMPVMQGRVVLLCLEDSAEELDRRLYYIVRHYCKRYALDKAARKELHALVLNNVRYESIEGQQLHIIAEEKNHNIMPTPELNGLAQKLKSLKPVLIIIDPLSQLHSLNENDNSVGSAIVSAIGHIRTVTGAAILVPAHVSKAADDRGTKSANAMRGASSFATGARSVIHGDVLDAKEAVTRFQIDDEREARDKFAIFTHVKNNYGPKAEPIYMVRGYHGVWEPHDETVYPKRDRSASAVQDLVANNAQFHKWANDRQFTQTELVNARETAFPRKVSERYVKTLFDEAVQANIFREQGSRRGFPLYECKAEWLSAARHSRTTEPLKNNGE